MHYFKFDDLTAKERYKMMIGTVIPRPIALVTTRTDENIINVAPFSFYNIASYDPPLLSLSLIRKEGELKHTAKNLLENKAAVVHVTDEDNMLIANLTSGNYPKEVSELTVSGFETVASELLDVPGLEQTKIRFETKLHDHYTIKNNEGQSTADLFFLKILAIHLRDDVYENSYILPEKLKPVSRLAGHDYASLGKISTVKRPD